MKIRSEITAASVIYVLFVFFAVSRFLYFDATNLLPSAGIDYGHLVHWTHTKVSDSLAIQQTPDASLFEQPRLGKTASLFAAPFFWLALKASGKAEFSVMLLIVLEFIALCLILVSLWWLRKFLLNFFDDDYTIFFILVVSLATTVNASFALNGLSSDLFEFASIASALYFISVWQKEPTSNNFLKCASTFTISVFLNPVAFFLIPFALLFRSPSNLSEIVQGPAVVFRLRIALLSQGKNLLISVCLMIVIGLALIFSLFLVSDFASVTILERSLNNIELLPQLVLSYRKGWWLFVPFSALAMFALIVYSSASKANALAVLLSILTAFLCVLLTGGWWENNALAIPELNGVIILLVFPTYALISKCKEQGEVASIMFSLYFLGCLFYTQFFVWQIGNGILNPEKLSKHYFYNVLFSLEEPDELNQARILEKGFMPGDKLNYITQVLFETDFTIAKEFTILDLNNPFHRINADAEYAISRKFSLNPGQYIKDALLEIRFRYRMSSGLCNTGPFAVADIEAPNERYGYQNFFLESDASANWQNFSALYKLPEIKNPGDLLNFYIWNNGKCYIDIDDVQLTIFEPKEKHISNDVFLID